MRIRRSVRSSVHSAVLAGLVLGLAAAPCLPLAAQEPVPGIFSDVVDVRVVNVEAVVTDRQGNRVSGLGADDFRLLVDGKEVPVEYFSEVLGGQVVEAGAAREEGPQGLPSLVPGEAVGTSYLVFVDDFFPIERDRNRVLASLRQQIPLLNPEDRMAVVAFDGHRLTMLTSWNQSQAGLERALTEAERRPAGGLERVAEQRKFIAGRGLAAFERLRLFGDGISSRLTAEERFYAELLVAQVKRVVSAASATLRSFAQPPGRKVMLLLSGGWPFDPVQAASEDQRFAVLDTELERGYELFRPLSDTANLLGYTLYPVDVPGLQGESVSASQQEAPQVGAAALSPEQEAQYSLSYLAARTGGRALLNARRVNALGEAASDTRSYYWLGFTANRARDDRPHRIEVEVRRPDTRVRSRRGYLDFSRRAEVSAMVESTLLFGSAPSSGALPVEVGRPRPAGIGRMDAPLTLAIPVDAITLLAVGDRYVSELELRIAVLDEDGNQAEIPVIVVRLDGREPPKPGGYIRYDTSLKLRKRNHEVVLALYDPASGRLLSNRVEIKP